MGGRTRTPAPAAPAPAPAADKPMSQQAAEDKSARRRARRGGRAMLSDTRLNPEQGVSTLGAQGL